MTYASIEKTKLAVQKGDLLTTLVIALLAIFCPLLAFPVSLYVIYHNKKQWRICIFAMSMFFAAMSYCYTPAWENDLVRYWVSAENMSNQDFMDAVLGVYRASESKVYLFNLMAWIAGRTDLHLMPAVSAYVVYYISFYITCRIGEKYCNNWKHTFGYLVFIMCFLNFYEVTETVRNIMAFSMVEAAVFRDIYEEKKDLKTLALYILPIFIHPTALLLVAIRLVFNLASKIKIILLFLLAFIPLIINWVYDAFFGVLNISAINTVIAKAYNYFLDNTSMWGIAIQGNLYYDIRRIVYISFTIITCIYFISNIYMSKVYSSEKTVSLRTNKLQNYVFIIILLALSCTNTLTHEYWRFVSALVIFGGVYYIPYAEGVICRKFSLIVILFSYIFCALGAVLSLYFFTLKNFNGINTIFSSMPSTCPIFILLKDLLIFMDAL